jgi:N-acetyl-alpha-D-glucosaminyl L-malate synthase BshA
VNVGIVCYPSVGGSGVVATELGKALARRGHQVHVISTETPFRLGEYQEGLSFHQVMTPTYPLFREPQYLLSLANKIVQVAREFRLDVVHAHYAVPHAAAAFMAQQVIGATDRRAAPRVITTLHGTDITLVGSDPSYRRVVAFSIARSHGVTAVSHSLRADTIASLGIEREIVVIPNFLDCDRYRRIADPLRREQIAPRADYDAVVVHMSNFRPVKRIDVAMDVFRRIRERVRARLLLIGDGPVRPDIESQARELGLLEHVVFAGEQQDPVPWLSVGDLFLLPSAQESFGLAALEAMACEVPVVASNVGGLPEVIGSGVSGFLRDPTDHQGMAADAVALLKDPDLHRRVTQAASARVREEFCVDRVVPMYERYYERVLGR